MSTRAIDAVSLSIMWDRLVGITDEIISALMRSSFSTIVRESADLSVVILDTERERRLPRGATACRRSPAPHRRPCATCSRSSRRTRSIRAT